MNDLNASPILEISKGLDSYMASADETAAELLRGDNSLVAALRHYDDYLRSGLWAHVPRSSAIGFVLQMNAYMVFLAGVRMALSGHAAAVYPLLRTALESASYGLLIERDPGLADIWTHRHRSEADKKACRKAFTFDQGIVHLKDMAPDVYDLAKLAYEGAIDYGAHPNLKGVASHLSINANRPDGMTAVTLVALYGSAHGETVRSLCACLDFGFAIIGMIALTGPDLDPGDDLVKRLIEELQALNDLKNEAVAPYQRNE
ncbi:hypothetical protein [Paracoccus sediminilitoris]|uniref:hypothetical protein n=1 Tax=Paracoccus sediminilitoris TaxID=2202419 RepID=UPI0018F2D5D6|nr:hypothetical protein [Paracoccus sediminilitoris]